MAVRARRHKRAGQPRSLRAPRNQPRKGRIDRGCCCDTDVVRNTVDNSPRCWLICLTMSDCINRKAWANWRWRVEAFACAPVL
jgi:hypothetical protein